MHGLAEFADIESNAKLTSLWFWYRPDFPGHAVIEIIFRYKDKFITAFFEGFRDTEDGTNNGIVSCHKFYSNTSDIGMRYLKNRSPFYCLIHYSEIVGFSMNYKDAFNGAIREINDFYVGNKWAPSEVVNGKIKLNNDCLWYAINLFSKVGNISVDELLANQNITIPIILLKKRKDFKF